MRLFIALVLPERVKKILARVQAELRQSLPLTQIKWVEPENFHQTLIFLGEVPEARLEEVKQILTQIQLEPMKLSLKKLGFFPDQHRPRVIWVGLKGELEKLSACFHRLRLALNRANFDFDTRFASHITLGRVRFGRGKVVFNQTIIEKINQILKEKNLNFIADQIVLFQSQLRPRGPIYTPLLRLKLRKKED